jgi:hypothetical protein
MEGREEAAAGGVPHLMGLSDRKTRVETRMVATRKSLMKVKKRTMKTASMIPKQFKIVKATIKITAAPFEAAEVSSAFSRPVKIVTT